MRAPFDRADLVSLLVAGSIITGTLVAPWIETSGILPAESVCLSQRIAGIECPGCGMTRSFVALGWGELGRSLSLNWLAPAMLALALLHVAARTLKLARPSIRLRTFDLASVLLVIAIHLARSIEIWM